MGQRFGKIVTRNNALALSNGCPGRVTLVDKRAQTTGEANVVISSQFGRLQRTGQLI